MAIAETKNPVTIFGLDLRADSTSRISSVGQGLNSASACSGVPVSGVS